MLPNFLVIGAEKAGTTTLATMLSEHPDVFMCAPKEPRFFSHQWEKGLPWYESLFTDAGTCRMIGEASPSYTWAPDFPEVPARIHQSLGEIKYVYILRHPVKRILSHFRHGFFYRWYPDNTDFESAVQIVPSLKNCSRYYHQIEQHLPYSARAQWHVVIMEELIQNPRPIANELFRFLGIQEIPDLKLPSANVMDDMLRPPRYVNYSKSRLLNAIRRRLPRAAREFETRMIAKFSKTVEKRTLPEGMEDQLRKELDSDIKHLCEFCGKDLEAIWHMNE